MGTSPKRVTTKFKLIQIAILSDILYFKYLLEVILRLVIELFFQFHF